MTIKIVLLSLLFCCASEAQGQGDDTSLPLSYNITKLQGDGATCPNEQLRQETREDITSDIRDLLIESALPLLNPPTPLPQCPCTSGGGTRVAYLNMTDPDQQCPPAWNEITLSNVRACWNNETSFSCESANYSSHGISYSQVCGRVTGYQYCGTFAFAGNIDDINSVYVDGVSITHGSPRQHVWTFAAAFDDSDPSSSTTCPCVDSANFANSFVPLYVGDDYFCDTAYVMNPIPYCPPIETFLPVAHPLWDGGGCGPNGGCCESNNPPWFCKTLPQPTTDDIEVRICQDEAFPFKGIIIELVEIYIS